MDGSAFFRFRGKITQVDSEAQLRRRLGDLSSEPVLGLDVETKPAFKKGEVHPPALLQLATEREAFLVKLLRFDAVGVLKPVLESAGIVKAGIGIVDDVKKLLTRGDFQPAGFVEIADIARKLGYEKSSVKFLAKEVLGMQVSKASRLTNWENEVLTAKQVDYAATDAFLSRELFLRLSERAEAALSEDIAFCKFPSRLPLQGCGPS